MQHLRGVGMSFDYASKGCMVVLGLQIVELADLRPSADYFADPA